MDEGLPRLALDDVEVYEDEDGDQAVRALSYIPAGTEVGVCSRANETRFIRRASARWDRANLTRVHGALGTVMRASRDIAPGDELVWDATNGGVPAPQTTFSSAFADLAERFAALDEAVRTSVPRTVQNKVMRALDDMMFSCVPPDEDGEEEAEPLHRCMICWELFPKTERYFDFTARTPNGKKYARHGCKTCYTTKERIRHYKRKRKGK